MCLKICLFTHPPELEWMPMSLCLRQRKNIHLYLSTIFIALLDSSSSSLLECRITLIASGKVVLVNGLEETFAVCFCFFSFIIIITTQFSLRLVTDYYLVICKYNTYFPAAPHCPKQIFWYFNRAKWTRCVTFGSLPLKWIMFQFGGRVSAVQAEKYEHPIFS